MVLLTTCHYEVVYSKTENKKLKHYYRYDINLQAYVLSNTGAIIIIKNKKVQI